MRDKRRAPQLDMPVEVVVDDCIRLPSGDGRIGLVDHRDVAAVGVAALTRPGHENRAYLLNTQSLLLIGNGSAL